ncbi:MAG: response regulator [Pseudomonadota bacterium]
MDDEEEFVKALAERLKLRDLGSDTVYNGEGALEYVESQEPDVMVLDLKMPGIDGMEVLKRVKQAYPNIEVIILTGHGTKKDEEKARTLGVFDYLEKPIDIEKLVKRMRDAFRRKLDKYTTAATFAEAGESDEAKRILDKE